MAKLLSGYIAQNAFRAAGLQPTQSSPYPPTRSHVNYSLLGAQVKGPFNNFVNRISPFLDQPPILCKQCQ